jgi:UDPglucose 6-dehydrogenase
MTKVAMIGVGKLGQDCAEVMAQHYDVVGYDVEPRNPAFNMLPSIEEAVLDRDIIFIAAPTPHEPLYGGETPTSHLPNKNFNYTTVQEILEEVNKYVNQTQLVVLISTVLPGTVRNSLRPCITNARFIYNPYLIAMGTIKYDMVNPEMVIIGTEDGSITGDAQELIDFYKVFMENDPRYVVGTWDEAESIKIFYNTFISTKLALVNMIQDVAETNGNINVDIVTQALADSKYRIMGPAYMKAALGDGGACHPRDNIALRWLAEELNLGYDLFDSIIKARELQAERMALRCLKNGKNVTIVGKAYKPKVPYTHGSASMLVGHYIEQHGGNVRYYDINTGDTDLGTEWTDVYLIGYWEEYVEQIQFPRWTTVIDPWRKLAQDKCDAEIIHYGNTRPLHRYVTTPAVLQGHIDQLFEVYRDLVDIKEQIHVIYAGIHSTQNFILRPFEDISNEILTAFQNGKTKFLFDCSAEDFLPYIVLKIQRIAKYFEGTIPSSAFVYVTGASNVETAYDKMVEKYQIASRIHVISANYIEYGVKKKNAVFEFSGDYSETGRGKRYVCFNKVPRKHRVDLLEILLQRNLVKDGYVSFEGTEGWLDRLDAEIYPSILREKDKFPLRLNITEERTNPVDLIPDDLQYFSNSYFSVVTETVFYPSEDNNSTIFLTEKIFKPIICNHPFIVLGRPGTLKKLKEFGYKTFHPYIDERYDDIQDDKERMLAVANEIERLSNPEYLFEDSWHKNIKLIVEYNKNVFFEKKNHGITVDVVGTIMSEPLPGVEIVEKNKSHTETGTNKTDNAQPQITQTLQNEESKWDEIGRNPPAIDDNGIYVIPSDSVYDQQMIKHEYSKVLSSGIKLSFSHLLDGGGANCSEDIVNVVKQLRTSKYQNALEWCAGMGAIGFDILGHNLSERVAFHEAISFAEPTIVRNALDNDLLERIKVYISNTISSLPNEEKFDLVFANPPHVDDFFSFLRNSRMQRGNPASFLSAARMCVDHKFAAHKEFFKNIRNYLTDDADVLLIENTDNFTLKGWARENGLQHINSYKLPIYEEIIKGNMISARIMHFKPRL